MQSDGLWATGRDIVQLHLVWHDIEQCRDSIPFDVQCDDDRATTVAMYVDNDEGDNETL